MSVVVACSFWIINLASGQNSTPPAGEGDPIAKAKAVLARAIEAHGGMETLARNRMDRVRLKGMMVVQDREVPFEAETVMNLPEGFRNQVTLMAGTQGQTVLVQLMHKGKASLFFNGMAQPMPQSQLDEFRETMLIQQAMRLVSLAGESGFSLEWAGQGLVNDRLVDWLLVRAEGRRPLRMSFDRETGYLVRTSHTVLVGGKPVLQEETYGDFRKLGAYKRPIKMITTRDGKLLVEAQLVDVRYPDRISEAEFLSP